MLILIFYFLCKASIIVYAKQLPNIIFILTDDQGYADVGYHGSPIPTPNLNLLASFGIKIAKLLYTSYGYTFQSGPNNRYAANVQLSEYGIPYGGLQGIDDRFITLPQALKAYGYATHMVGKWHLGSSKPRLMPRQKGFDSFFGTTGSGINHVSKQIGNGVYDLMENDHVFWDNKTHATDLFGARAKQVIEYHAKLRSARPLFLYLAFTAPHDPLIPDDQDLDACQHINHYIRRRFCAMVHGVDRNVGAIVKTLEVNNLMKNTIIVFSSDNGGSPWSGGLNYPFRGSKHTGFEGGVRVPAFIYSQKFFNGRSSYKNLFHIADWYPTLVSIVRNQLGLATNDTKLMSSLDGVDHFKSLTGEVKVPPRDRILIHHSVLHKSIVYRRGPWKLIVGQASLPLAEVEVFTEPNKWINEAGNICDTFAEYVIWFLDTMYGLENAMSSFRSVVATLANRMHPWYDEGANPVKLRNNDSRGVFEEQSLKKLNIDELMDHSKEEKDPTKSRYPSVALFNLETDPIESENLASEKRNLVIQLLNEATKLLREDALPLYVGDAYDKMAPKFSAVTDFFAQSSNLGQVVPALPWLNDDVDISKFPQDRMGYFLTGTNQNSIAWQMGILFAAWALIPIAILYILILCC